jgi:hypothetical protein
VVARSFAAHVLHQLAIGVEEIIPEVLPLLSGMIQRTSSMPEPVIGVSSDRRRPGCDPCASSACGSPG